MSRVEVIFPKFTLRKSSDPGAAVNPLPENPGNEKLGWFAAKQFLDP